MNHDSIINEVVHLRVDLQEFSVRITEDRAEIIDFGPRYDLEEVGSELSADNGSGCGGGASEDDFADDNSVAETPPGIQGLSGSLKHLTLHQLDIVQSLGTTPTSENDELKEGKLVCDQSQAAIRTDAVVPALRNLEAVHAIQLSPKGSGDHHRSPISGQILSDTSPAGPAVHTPQPQLGPNSTGPVDLPSQPIIQSISEASSLPTCQHISSKVL